MNINVDIVFFFLFIITFVFVVPKQMAQLKQVKTQQVLIVLNGLSFLLFALGQGLFISEYIGLNEFLNLTKVLLSFISSIYLTLVGIICLQSTNAKKIKTLWRIPAIGLLTGMYFEFKYVSIICAGQIFLYFLIPFKNKDHFRYLLYRLLPFIVCFAFMFILKPISLYQLNIMMIAMLLSGGALTSISLVNSIVGQKVSHENS